jgi:hypothetical protein
MDKAFGRKIIFSPPDFMRRFPLRLLQDLATPGWKTVF